MTSRLDRLFILLESGSSAVTRRAAAKQIGEVQKFYPHELHHLLNRLITYLHSNSWDTRIAASQAVEAILKNVPDWVPLAIKVEQQKKKKNEDEEKKHFERNLLSFAEFNLSHILQKGARLIGSEGSEFDMHRESDATKSAERLSRQRALLNEKLGVTQATRLGVNLNDLITDEDVKEGCNNYNINEEKVSIEHILNININTNTSSSASTSSNGHSLSCREINRAKRKARQNISINASTSSTNLSRSNSSSNASNQPDEPDKKKIKCETSSRSATELFYSMNSPVPDATGAWVDAVSWPLENFCVRLYLDLLNPKWEIRHGSATALRELINNHSGSAGKTLSMTQEEMEKAHIFWLEDAALRLLCVLALDRFGDFVSDQVVAPVRETCAQVLGTIVRDMPTEKVHDTVNVLLQLIKQNEWEVRHGGLLGLKYIFVVREDLLQIFLPLTISDILIGLFDSVEDVGAVAASTLIPVSSWLPKLLNPIQVSTIVKMLWDLLLDQDELTSACNSFMGLLAAVLSLPNASTWIQMEPMSTLVPRLWPFLSHSTSSVRRSTLTTLKILTQGTKGDESLTTQNLETKAKDDISFDSKNLKLNFGVIDWQSPLLQEALRHIYQRILVEPVWDIQELAKEVWMNLIDYANLTALLHAACPYVSPWICLAMQPARLPFDTNILIQTAQSQVSERRRNRDDLGGCSNLHQKMFLGGNEATSQQVREINFIRARINAARILGALSHFLVQPAPGIEYNSMTESPMECYTKVMLGHLQSRSAVQRTVCALIIAFWAQADSRVRPSCAKLQEKLRYCVMEYVYYDEVALSLTRLLQDAHDFIATIKQYKIPINDFNNAKILTLEQIEALSTTMTENLKLKHNLKPKLGDMLEERRKCLLNSYQQTNTERNIYDISTQAALSGAIVCMRCLPDKLNPVVKPLMESIKREERELLQQLSAEFLVYLMDQISDRNPSPNNKIVTNLCTLLKSDSEYTPLVVTQNLPAEASDHYYGILTLSQQQKNEGGQTNSVNASRGPGRPPTVIEVPVDIGSTVFDSNEAKQCRIQRIGSTYTIEFTCKYFKTRLNEKVPIIWQIMFGKIDNFLSANKTMDLLNDKLVDPTSANDLMTALQLIEIAGPCIDTSLHEELFKLLPKLEILIRHPLKAVRHMVARCIATLGNIDSCKTINFVVENVMGLLKKIENVIWRQGAIEAIERMVEKLQIKMVPYAVLLVVPLLEMKPSVEEGQVVELNMQISPSTSTQIIQRDGVSFGKDVE